MTDYGLSILTKHYTDYGNSNTIEYQIWTGLRPTGNGDTETTKNTASNSGFEVYNIRSSAYNPIDETDDELNYAFFSTSTGVEGFEIAILAKGDAIGNGNKGGYVLL